MTQHLTREEIQARFPGHTVRQDANPECRHCGGVGVMRARRWGGSEPCFCAVSSVPHGEAKSQFMAAHIPRQEDS